ncbi:hypothetical protein QA601_04860 [Chitinispirillales bacterium ANBcel5]|uniref:hypothetical protein n=1 Tax=Cellulosispirillum alkaliphilum TaxID=3039283 RepID=UPI002A507B71|nr:hypothetical protein [Chitinispirillales bacterium ANBcel5]
MSSQHTTPEYVRKPLRNFFIKKSIQTRVVVHLFVAMTFSAIITTALLSFFYLKRFDGGSFYFMSSNIMEDLQLIRVLSIVLPALIVAEISSIFIALTLGLFTSRKIAVPVYKIERWASRLRAGKLNTYMGFREKEMAELSSQCNAVSEFYRELLTQIKNSTVLIENNRNDNSTINTQLQQIKTILDKVELD